MLPKLPAGTEGGRGWLIISLLNRDRGSIHACNAEDGIVALKAHAWWYCLRRQITDCLSLSRMQSGRFYARQSLRITINAMTTHSTPHTNSDDAFASDGIMQSVADSVETIRPTPSIVRRTRARTIVSVSLVSSVSCKLVGGRRDGTHQQKRSSWEQGWDGVLGGCVVG